MTDIDAIEFPSVKVRMSPELMEQWATRDAEGYRLEWSWGEPDDEGFHTPTITRLNDDHLETLLLARLHEVEAERDEVKTWAEDQISIQLVLQEERNAMQDERDAAKDEAAFWKEEARLCNKRYDVPVKS